MKRESKEFPGLTLTIEGTKLSSTLTFNYKDFTRSFLVGKAHPVPVMVKDEGYWKAPMEIKHHVGKVLNAYHKKMKAKGA